jgi:Phosphotransferase enzyme family
VTEGPDRIAGAMALLLGADAARIVAPAAPSGAAIRSLRAAQVLFRPRQRVSVTYRATLEWSDGERVDEMIVASASRGDPPAGAATSLAGEHVVAVWRAPEDPLLPGLGRALDIGFAHRLLTDAGVKARTARVTLRAYRPGRRAVVEVWPVEPERSRLVFARGSGTLRAKTSVEAPALYLKVLPPERATAVADVHARLSGIVPAPPCSPADGSGVLRLGALSGVSLGRCLRRGTPRAPAVADLLELLDRLDDAVLEGGPGTGADVRLRRFTSLLQALVPDEGDRLGRLHDALHGAREQPTVTIHGDFHEGNILVANGAVSGLLDVDDAGPGERVDDLGLLVGRLWSLGEPARPYTEDLLRRSDAVVDPGELRRRVGIALVGRATAPFRNQFEDWRAETSARLRLAERWVAAP